MALASNPQERSGLIFSHRQHLDQAGAVARMGVSLGGAKGYGGALTCASCHRPTPGASGFRPVEMERAIKHEQVYGHLPTDMSPPVRDLLEETRDPRR